MILTSFYVVLALLSLVSFSTYVRDRANLTPRPPLVSVLAPFCLFVASTGLAVYEATIITHLPSCRLAQVFWAASLLFYFLAYSMFLLHLNDAMALKRTMPLRLARLLLAVTLLFVLALVVFFSVGESDPFLTQVGLQSFIAVFAFALQLFCIYTVIQIRRERSRNSLLVNKSAMSRATRGRSTRLQAHLLAIIFLIFVYEAMAIAFVIDRRLERPPFVLPFEYVFGVVILSIHAITLLLMRPFV